MKLHATIFGSSAPQAGSREYQEAQQLGELLTRKGFRVKNGGYYGTMEACSRGALEGGGKALGIPFAGFDPKAPNVYAEIQKVRTLFERLDLLITGSDLIVTLPGGLGTLSEIATTWMMLQTGLFKPKPIVCCVGSTWKALMRAITQNMEVTPADVDLLKFFASIDQFREQIDNVMRQIEERPI
ncbi:MAG: hypothetical protein ACD_51C00006G0002 [uncultured bacterium]|nr:MAG: hypothetical protein ACD_51C00006G0002 [uncultured bacterium]